MSDAPQPFAEWAPAVALLRDALRALPGWREESLTIERDGPYDVLRWTIGNGTFGYSRALSRLDLRDLDRLRFSVVTWVDAILRETRGRVRD